MCSKRARSAEAFQGTGFDFGGRRILPALSCASGETPFRRTNEKIGDPVRKFCRSRKSEVRCGRDARMRLT